MAVRARSRPIVVSGPATIATYVVDISITSEERLRTAAIFVGEARGFTSEQVANQIAPDGQPDIGATILFLMEEAVTAFAAATGAVIGTPEVFIEEPKDRD